MSLVKNTVRTVSFFGSTVGIACASLIYFKAPPEASHYAFNWYSLTYASCIVGMFFLLFQISKKENRNNITFWLATFITLSIISNLFSILMCLSLDTATYELWYHPSTFTTILILPFYLFFVLTITGNERHIYKRTLWINIFSSGMLLFYVDATTNWFNVPSLAVRYPWGYLSYPPTGKYTVVYFVWTQIFSVAGIALLIRHYLKVRQNPRKKRQTLILVLGATLPLIIGSITLSALPSLGINVPPMLPFATLFEISFFGYAIFKYKVFNLEPAALAETILETMNESVVTVNAYGEIEHINPNAVKLLGLKNDVHGQQIGKFLMK